MHFNQLNYPDRENKIKEITFEVLTWWYKGDGEKLKLIDEVKKLIDKDGKEIVIKYKTKMT